MKLLSPSVFSFYIILESKNILNGEGSLIGTCVVGQIRILIHPGFAVVDWYFTTCSPTRCSLRRFTNKERLLRKKKKYHSRHSSHQTVDTMVAIEATWDSINSERDEYICDVVLMKCYEHYYYYRHHYICILIVLRLFFLLVVIPCT